MPDIQPILRADPTERVSLSKSPTHAMPNESPRNFQDLQRQDPRPRMSSAYHPPPGVLKDLEEYIAKIPSSVSSVRAAFENVDGRLESVASSQPADCKSVEELKEQWRVIKESYSTVLHKSSEIAIQSATAVNDFIMRVIPFVENEDPTISLETKQAELTQYQKRSKKVTISTQIVDEDKGHAAQFSRTFTDIRSDVQAFKLKCAAYKKHIKDSLVGAIRKLEGEIKKLDSAVRKVKAIFAVFRNSISNSKEREKLRDAVNNASKRAKIEKCAGLQEAKSKLRQIDYDTDVIHDKSEGVEKEMSLLVTVWRMVGIHNALGRR
ncbi:hypothetical protein SCHPADRAFT_890013 [Schizopora paradoxa]|uniref:Uncharacterized protein n=1 Tax=Schizopora paradoxa TaxID=27342 RepID=A0A0H2S9E6_9AGAM|nr:hypothetical protein SCHPADRAFT_890013 [Schizopora paradoxa]